MARTSSLIDVLVMAYGGPNNLGEQNLMDVRRGRPTAPQLRAGLAERVRDKTKEAGWR
jgi:hypothetical protein